MTQDLHTALSRLLRAAKNANTRSNRVNGCDAVPQRVLAAAAQALETANRAPAWIRWHGGGCPVDPRARVEYRMRGALLTGHDDASILRWSHDGSPGDITHFRVTEVPR